jgi:hypothetical protein
MADNNIAVPLAVTNRSVPAPALADRIAVPMLLRSWSTKVPTIPNASISVPHFTINRSIKTPAVTGFSLSSVNVTVIVTPTPRLFTVTKGS